MTLAPLLLSSSVTIKLNLPVAKLDGNEAITVWQRRHTLQTRSLMFVSRLLPRGKKHKHSDSRCGVHWSDRCHFQHLNLQAFFSQYTAQIVFIPATTKKNKQLTGLYTRYSGNTTNHMLQTLTLRLLMSYIYIYIWSAYS